MVRLSAIPVNRRIASTPAQHAHSLRQRSRPGSSTQHQAVAIESPRQSRRHQSRSHSDRKLRCSPEHPRSHAGRDRQPSRGNVRKHHTASRADTRAAARPAPPGPAARSEEPDHPHRSALHRAAPLWLERAARQRTRTASQPGATLSHISDMAPILPPRPRACLRSSVPGSGVWVVKLDRRD